MCILGSHDLAARQERSQQKFHLFYPYNYSFGELLVIFMMPRGRKRKATVPPPVEDDGVNEQAGKTGAVIDFEEIIKASQILPTNQPTAECSAGNNRISVLPQQQDNVLLDITSSQNPGFSTVTDAPTLPFDTPPTTVATLQNLHLPSPGMPATVTSTVLFNNPATTGSNLHCLAPVSPIRLANDDLASHVPASLKARITKGEFINLALLLKGAVELADHCNSSVLKLNSDGALETSRKECKEKITSIEKWTNAFLIYASIYLQAFPDKTLEVIHYMYNIRECAGRQSGYAWREYDEQFRLRQASAPASWSAINNDLWWRCVLVTDHASQAKPSSDRLKYTCHDYNKGNCRWPNCKFTHACARCGSSHPEATCSNTKVHNTASQASEHSQITSFRGRPFQRFRGRGRGSFGATIKKQ